MDDQARNAPTGGFAMLRAEPQIFVADVKAASDFYVGKLGFKREFLHGDPPFYGQVSRSGAYLNLRCVKSPLPEPGLRDREQLLSAAITVTGIDAMVAEYTAAGIKFFEPLTRQPWGARTCIVRDHDGNLILFAE